MAKRNRYNKDFRLQAAQLVVHQGYSQAEAARRLGVYSNSIANWIKDLRASGDLVENGETRIMIFRSLRMFWSETSPHPGLMRSG
jgi:transposase-like protein